MLDWQKMNKKRDLLLDQFIPIKVKNSKKKKWAYTSKSMWERKGMRAC